jgi:hypothetical protein
MQLAMDDVPSLPSVPVDQWDNRVVDKAYRCERRAPWQQIHEGEFRQVEESRQP